MHPKTVEHRLVFHRPSQHHFPLLQRLESLLWNLEQNSIPLGLCPFELDQVLVSPRVHAVHLRTEPRAPTHQPSKFLGPFYSIVKLEKVKYRVGRIKALGNIAVNASWRHHLHQSFLVQFRQRTPITVHGQPGSNEDNPNLYVASHSKASLCHTIYSTSSTHVSPSTTKTHNNKLLCPSKPLDF
mmetsp:Transcript_32284/g.51524  ORF Transcript_32284/g.51524 Transcript_32284/m.51524 type:complete len:184 (-) Transcript_32284:15-566(-)